MSESHPRPFKSLCVFCGASAGFDPDYAKTAEKLGVLLAERGITLVYGGGDIGMMGIVSQACRQAGGRALGIITTHLVDIEKPAGNASELVVVETMHERKNYMYEASDAFCILPGGYGTLDEAFEAITWRQLRLHDKPIIILNQNGYWDPLLVLLKSIITQGFASPETAALYEVATDAVKVLDLAEQALASPRPFPVSKGAVIS